MLWNTTIRTKKERKGVSVNNLLLLHNVNTTGKTCLKDIFGIYNWMKYLIMLSVRKQFSSSFVKIHVRTEMIRRNDKVGFQSSEAAFSKYGEDARSLRLRVGELKHNWYIRTKIALSFDYIGYQNCRVVTQLPNIE